MILYWIVLSWMYGIDTTYVLLGRQPRPVVKQTGLLLKNEAPMWVEARHTETCALDGIGVVIEEIQNGVKHWTVGIHKGPDDGGSKDLWNVGKLLPDYTALQPRRQPSS
jgi:hypothetical protein